MCGRFTLKTPANVLIEHFRLAKVPTDELPLFEPRYNISPTQQVNVIRKGSGEALREVVQVRWGLVPFWAADPTIGNRMINARGESVAEKPSFRRAFKSQRCLIPADGFYEWKKEGTRKQPYYIHLRNGGPFAFAGLWERWKPKDSESSALETCTIITTEANDLMRSLHDRMPVILPEHVYDIWLDTPDDGSKSLLPLLVPCSSDDFVTRRVSTHVNRPGNDDPGCIESD